MIKEVGSKVSSHIKMKIDKIHDEANRCLEEAYSYKKDFKLHVSLAFEHSALGDILNDEERYQQVCFITRFQCLPSIEGVMIEEKSGNHYFSNLDYIRHVLNEYRLILFNKNDSIYYKKLHSFCYRKLLNYDPLKGLSIKAYDINKNDKTEEFIRFLNASTKAIDYVVSHCELDYLYNGILQHADTRHSKRYWDDYYSGEINYIFFKNAILVSETKNLMDVYYKIMNVLTFPVLGPL